jgi:hypothetical protein
LRRRRRRQQQQQPVRLLPLAASQFFNEAEGVVVVSKMNQIPSYFIFKSFSSSDFATQTKKTFLLSLYSNSSNMNTSGCI